MTARDKTQDVVFMSTCLLKHLSCSEAYVFAHVAFFMSQRKFNNGVFKQTTQAIANKTGYSPNTVRAALNSLIEKNFLSKHEGKGDDFKENNFTYIQQVAHKLVPGSNEYANQYIHEFRKMLSQTVRKKKGSHDIERQVITFFKVPSGLLASSLPQVASRKDKNLSKHYHRLLILHGYLTHHNYFNQQRGRGAITRTISFLSNMTNWSANTIRRLLNSLSALGNIDFLYQDKAVTFSKVSANFVLGKITTLKTKLVEAAHNIKTQTNNSLSNTINSIQSNGSLSYGDNVADLIAQYGPNK